MKWTRSIWTTIFAVMVTWMLSSDMQADSIDLDQFCASPMQLSEAPAAAEADAQNDQDATAGDEASDAEESGQESASSDSPGDEASADATPDEATP